MRLGGRFGQQSFRGHRDRNEQQTHQDTSHPRRGDEEVVETVDGHGRILPVSFHDRVDDALMPAEEVDAGVGLKPVAGIAP